MALKDWKLIQDSSNNRTTLLWRNDKIKKTLLLAVAPTTPYNIEHHYRYYTQTRNIINYYVRYKMFKTKPQALKYAKDYMKTH